MGALVAGGCGCSAASGAAPGAHASGVTRSGEPRLPIWLNGTDAKRIKAKGKVGAHNFSFFNKNRFDAANNSKSSGS